MASSVSEECLKYPVPQGVVYGALQRQTSAQAHLTFGQFVRWTALTHGGYRYAQRCLRCGDAVSPAESAELETIHKILHQAKPVADS